MYGERCKEMGTYKADRRTLVFFSSVRQALNKEVTQHPALGELLRNHPASEFELRLAEIAKFCGVALDGEYYGDDIDNICSLCLDELKKRSSVSHIILPSSRVIN